jgi:hypothetical protein
MNRTHRLRSVTKTSQSILLGLAQQRQQEEQITLRLVQARALVLPWVEVVVVAEEEEQ